MIVRAAPRPPLGAEVPSLSHVRSKWWLAGGINPNYCIAAYQPKRAGSFEISLLNLAWPLRYKLIGTARPYPMFDSGIGWIFSGNQALDTGIIPQGGWSVFCLYSQFVTAAGRTSLMGSWSGSGDTRFRLIPGEGVTGKQFANGGLLYGGATYTSGVMGFAGSRAYFDKNMLGEIPAWSGVSTFSAFIGARNGPTISELVTANIHAIAFYSSVLTHESVLALTSAMQII